MKLNSMNVGRNITVHISQQQLDSDKKHRQEENAETERQREDRDKEREEKDALTGQGGLGSAGAKVWVN